MSAETSQTLDRGLRVLEVLAGSPGGLTVTELAGRLGVNRTVVYRLVSTLEQHALLRRDAKGRLHIGLGILHLAGAVQPVLRDLAQPVLRRLAEKQIVEFLAEAGLLPEGRRSALEAEGAHRHLPSPPSYTHIHRPWFRSQYRPPTGLLTGCAAALDGIKSRMRGAAKSLF